MQESMQDLWRIAGGGLLLYFGAEWFVGGASKLALLLRVPQIVVGLTVVAYGTSAPEAIVGIEAARGGHGDVALGNVIGSNIANVGLILGITALLRPTRVDRSLRQRELPVLLLSSALVPTTLIDGHVSAIEAWVLLALAAAYTGWMVHATRSASDLRAAHTEAAASLELTESAGAPSARTKLASAVITVVGLLVLLVGGRLFVDGAIGAARSMGMSERVVGLTIVAVGTSLPELITAIIAAIRGHSDIAVGNVIGSNIFNVLLCLSAAALAGHVGGQLQDITLDVSVLGVVTLLAAVFIRSERTITRGEGAAALVVYAGFMAYVVLAG